MKSTPELLNKAKAHGEVRMLHNLNIFLFTKNEIMIK